MFTLWVISEMGGKTYSGRPNVDSTISVSACGILAAFMKARSLVEMSPV